MTEKMTEIRTLLRKRLGEISDKKIYEKAQQIAIQCGTKNVDSTGYFFDMPHISPIKVKTCAGMAGIIIEFEDKEVFRAQISPEVDENDHERSISIDKDCFLTVYFYQEGPWVVMLDCKEIQTKIAQEKSERAAAQEREKQQKAAKEAEDKFLKQAYQIAQNIGVKLPD